MSGRTMGRCVTELYTLHFLFLIFIFTQDRIALSSTVNPAPRASRAGHMSPYIRAYLFSYCIPYSHLLTRIRHHHWRRAVIRLFRRSYRHTRMAASITAASTPAWSTRHPTSLCLPGLIRPRAVHLLGMHRPHPSPIRVSSLTHRLPICFPI
jgi:hypothetical protein